MWGPPNMVQLYTCLHCATPLLVLGLSGIYYSSAWYEGDVLRVSFHERENQQAQKMLKENQSSQTLRMGRT